MKRFTDHFKSLYSKMGPKKLVEWVIFNSKWLLYFFFLKLIWTLIKLMWVFSHHDELPPETLINVLGSLDVVMIACLVKMIMTGSYNSFVSKDHGYKGENLSSNSLKIKMGSTILGVSSIDLLKVFINVDHIPHDQLWNIVLAKCLIHSAFIIGAYALVKIGYIHTQLEKMEIEVEEKEEELEEHHSGEDIHEHEEHSSEEREEVSTVHHAVI